MSIKYLIYTRSHSSSPVRWFLIHEALHIVDLSRFDSDGSVMSVAKWVYGSLAAMASVALCAPTASAGTEVTEVKVLHISTCAETRIGGKSQGGNFLVSTMSTVNNCGNIPQGRWHWWGPNGFDGWSQTYYWQNGQRRDGVVELTVRKGSLICGAVYDGNTERGSDCATA